MHRLEVVLLGALVAAGCASTDARWEAGATRVEDREIPATIASDVAVYFKKDWGVLEAEWEKRPLACHSTTLVRRMGLLDGPNEPPGGDVTELAELTTEEYPRDEKRSRILGRTFARTFGIGTDEHDLFEVFPTASAIEHGVRRLKEMAADLGADEVRDVFFTGYAEYQMWEGDTVSLTPTSPDSPIYTSVEPLELRLRDVRFHGTAVRHRRAVSR